MMCDPCGLAGSLANPVPLWRLPDKVLERLVSSDGLDFTDLAGDGRWRVVEELHKGCLEEDLRRLDGRPEAAELLGLVPQPPGCTCQHRWTRKPVAT